MEIPRSLKLIFILLAIILFLTAIPYFLSGNNQSPSNQSQAEPVAELPSDDIWSQLNVPFAEEHCLRLAKEYAVESGVPAMVIKSCQCSETKSEDMKSYSCTIESIDYSYPVKISCYQSVSMCTFESGFGTKSLTFEEAGEYLK